MDYANRNRCTNYISHNIEEPYDDNRNITFIDTAKSEVFYIWIDVDKAVFFSLMLINSSSEYIIRLVLKERNGGAKNIKSYIADNLIKQRILMK